MTVVEWIYAAHDWLKSVAAPAFGIAAVLGGINAAAFGGWRQRKRPDVPLGEPATSPYTSRRGQVMRLHQDHRDSLDGLREAVAEMTGAIRKLTRQVKAKAEHEAETSDA